VQSVTAIRLYFFNTGIFMNIDDMKLSDLKAIAAMFGAANNNSLAHPFVGKFVICRCFGAGVHAGELVSMTGSDVILKDSRRLWSWKANEGVALSGVAQNGMKAGQKIDTMNPLIALTDVIECIPCTDKSKESINGFA
jgi:hypothetical protein